MLLSNGLQLNTCVGAFQIHYTVYTTVYTPLTHELTHSVFLLELILATGPVDQHQELKQKYSNSPANHLDSFLCKNFEISPFSHGQSWPVRGPPSLYKREISLTYIVPNCLLNIMRVKTSRISQSHFINSVAAGCRTTGLLVMSSYLGEQIQIDISLCNQVPTHSTRPWVVTPTREIFISEYFN